MQKLALKIKQGDEQAFRVFFERTHHAVLRYLGRMLHDNRYTDDIAQDVYIKVWQNRLQIDPEQSLEGWLFTIVHNTTINHLQRLLSEKKRINALQLAETIPALDYNKGLIDLRQKDTERIYARAIRSIQPPQRLRCFRLHRENGFTYHQIAEIEGLAVKTVEGHISAVLKHLRKVKSLSQYIVGITLFQAENWCNFF